MRELGCLILFLVFTLLTACSSPTLGIDGSSEEQLHISAALMAANLVGEDRRGFELSIDFISSSYLGHIAFRDKSFSRKTQLKKLLRATDGLDHEGV